jgi:hypothetical protein
VLSGRGLCDELITRPEETYRLWCVVVCDLETSRMRRPWPTGGYRAKIKKEKIWCHSYLRLWIFTNVPKLRSDDGLENKPKHVALLTCFI